jgi:hypothetical protein
MNVRSMMVFALFVSPSIADDHPPKPEGREYKVAFWFEVDRPFATVKSRAYDLAKGEYDRATVDRWLKTIFDQHPRYGAMVRDVSTVGEPGATEADRLSSAMDREIQHWAGLSLGSWMHVPKVFTATRSNRTFRPAGGSLSFDRPAPGSPGPIANPPSMPFPYPYRSGPR